MRRGTSRGFTLIELSVVLVIIGLIIGAVLAGQSLISNAAVNGTIAQISKYNSAVNAFQNKYAALPGDLTPTIATSYGFTARGLWAGEGDGNGIIEGVTSNAIGQNAGYYEATGETVMFWVDLTTANGLNLNLIDGAFKSGSPTAVPANGYSSSGVGSAPLTTNYLPVAKLGGKSFIYVFSQNSLNYFGLASVLSTTSAGLMSAAPDLTVQQAYSIDKKIDDGLPQSGSVLAEYLYGGPPQWAPYPTGVSPGQTAVGSTSTCYDDGGSSSNPMQYSTEIAGNNNVNCALVFQFP